ncbi:DNA polymerase III, gamma/tau subunit [Cryptosporangium arvum DSM 44712]|uniref:DNA polymerase III subunit delta' n=1 Tax=Cryptosporangium arvum DSM 44712 TaxID=927661 RepID=A0A010YW20_9ACTN|nr:DNA polymerase III subunit delta' [Cryptosporangium arvum]EXG79328.1 DNA polymerase III, gamma/tau subunit [Cryptosporangium arvum DSM 44712]
MTVALVPGVFTDVIGQDEAVTVLARAAAAAGRIVAGEPVAAGEMTHAWLFTGPPGSGRSVAARAFAAALQCPRGGCGECNECHTTLAGTHADVRVVAPEGVWISVNEMRSLVLRAASAPSGGRWQIVLIEDADRLHERASNALLKAIEEPTDRTVFLLCAPSAHPDDVSVTIRSRSRVVPLRVPSAEAVAGLLTRRNDVDETTARWAASVAQGHVGRALRLARDPDAQARRRAVLAIPRSLTGIAACYNAAAALIAASNEEAAAATETQNADEKAALERALGAGGTGKGAAAATRGTVGQIKDLEKKQKSRTTRVQRDALDRALVDLAAFYRDVLMVRLGASVPLVHIDVEEMVRAAAARWEPESILRRIEAVLKCRTALDENVKPLIAIEALMVTLFEG